MLSWCLVTKSCLTPCDPMDCSSPGSSVPGVSQARILEWVAMPSSRDLFNPGLLHWHMDSILLATRGAQSHLLILKPSWENTVQAAPVHGV